LFALLAASATAGACQTRGAAPPSLPEHAMTELVTAIKAKDPAATLEARRLGPASAPAVIPLTRDADAEVREIALLCLAETGGNGAVTAMLAGVGDADPMVRAAALKGLERRATSTDIPGLAATLARADDPLARNLIALRIGALGTAGNLAALADACASHEDDLTSEGCVTARAWLGDPAARSEFVQRMGAARDRTLARYLDYAGRIRAPWLVPALVPVLDDTTPVRWIGVDGVPGPENLRAADVAVNLLAAIGGRPFSFPVSERTNYSVEQRAEVRRLFAR
jgi:HEAT repeat protein